MKGSIAAYHCAASIAGAVGRAGWIASFNRMKDGHLPRPGSWGEQSHRWCQGIDLLDAEISRRDAEALENQREESKRRGKSR